MNYIFWIILWNKRTWWQGLLLFWSSCCSLPPRKTSCRKTAWQGARGQENQAISRVGDEDQSVLYKVLAKLSLSSSKKCKLQKDNGGRSPRTREPIIRRWTKNKIKLDKTTAVPVPLQLLSDLSWCATRRYKVLQDAIRCYKAPAKLSLSTSKKHKLQKDTYSCSLTTRLLLLAQSGAAITIFWSVSVSNNVLPLASRPPRNTSCRNTFGAQTTVGPIRWRDQNNTKKTTRPTNQLPSRVLCDIVKLLRAPSNTEPLVDQLFIPTTINGNPYICVQQKYKYRWVEQAAGRMLGWVRFGADFLPDCLAQCTTNQPSEKTGGNREKRGRNWPRQWI